MVCVPLVVGGKDELGLLLLLLLLLLSVTGLTGDVGPTKVLLFEAEYGLYGTGL